MPTGYRLELTGQTFGRLTVLKKGEHPRKWLCQCECGTVKEIGAPLLRNGKAISCGCYQRNLIGERSFKHGLCGSRERSAWKNMRDRCNNPRNRCYDQYGARGITVCERWQNSFVNFLADMGRCPSPDSTLDRIDNGKGYEPGNCRWTDIITQQRNRRTCHLVTFNGKTQTITEWAEELNLAREALYYRLNKLGWSVERTLTTPTTKPYIWRDRRKKVAGPASADPAKQSI